MAENVYDELIRELLRRDKIKLWLAPYVSEDGHAVIPEDLIERYAKETSISTHFVGEALLRLQLHALSKLKTRAASSHLTSVKIKYVDPENTENEAPTEFTINIPHDQNFTGGNLQEAVAQHLKKSCVDFRLVAGGRILNTDDLLSSQNVTSTSEVLCIKVTQSEAATNEQSQAEKELDATKSIAQKFSTRDCPGSDLAFDIEDQKGNSMQLPRAERQALATALALHEKGRARLRNKKYAQALIFLLESETEFNQCRSEILNSVDNYAILCLDIVWCYLCLKSITNLPDAGQKLDSSESGFNRSYGPNLERVAILKRSTEAEKALFIRLWLLKGIYYHYRGELERSHYFINKAEDGIKSLEVDSEKLSRVMEMGYTITEARLALRTTKGDIEEAVNLITDRRKEDADNNQKRALERKYGRTIGGNWVDVQKVNSLIQMGFSQRRSVEALKNSDNDFDAALQYISSHPVVEPVLEPLEEYVTQLISMGFDPVRAAQAMKDHHNSIDAAISALTSESRGNTSKESSRSTSQSQSSSAASTPSTEKPPDVSPEEMNAIKSFSTEISRETDEYLDVTFEEETAYIQEYKLLLASARQSQ